MFTSGFFDSVNGDRTYSAYQFSQLFDGLITDGIYSNVGDAFAVVPGSGLGVKVKSGSAWFNHTWSSNTTDFPLSLEPADLLLPRIDAVVLEVDTRVSVRKNRMFIKTGTTAVSPSRPSLTKSDGLYQYALAYVAVAANADAIVVSNITSVRGGETPYVSAKLPINNITTIFQNLEQEFQDWFSSIQGIVASDSVISLAQSILVMTPTVNEMRPKLDALLELMPLAVAASGEDVDVTTI